MQQRENETPEKSLVEAAVAAYDKLEADPGRAIPADEVFAAIRTRHCARKATADPSTSSATADFAQDDSAIMRRT